MACRCRSWRISSGGNQCNPYHRTNRSEKGQYDARAHNKITALKPRRLKRDYKVSSLLTSTDRHSHCRKISHGPVPLGNIQGNPHNFPYPRCIRPRIRALDNALISVRTTSFRLLKSSGWPHEALFLQLYVPYVRVICFLLSRNLWDEHGNVPRPSRLLFSTSRRVGF